MKTIKTDKGIEFDIEFKEVWQSPSSSRIEIDYEVFCNQGSKEFIFVYYLLERCNITEEEAIEILFSECDFQAAKEWVDFTEVGFVLKELNDFIIKGQVLSFSISFRETITLTLKDKDKKTFTSKGIDDINEFLHWIKKESE